MSRPTKPKQPSPEESLTEAIRIVGKAALAKILKITPQALGQWTVCPPTRVLAVEEAVRKAQIQNSRALTRHHLRPDIYPASGQ